MENEGYHFGSHNKNNSILESILGSAHLGKLPCPTNSILSHTLLMPY